MKPIGRATAPSTFRPPRGKLTWHGLSRGSTLSLRSGRGEGLRARTRDDGRRMRVWKDRHSAPSTQHSGPGPRTSSNYHMRILAIDMGTGAQGHPALQCWC